MQSIYNSHLPELHLDRLLADNFLFFTDPTEATGTRSWGKDAEMQIAASILQNYHSILLEFSDAGVADPLNPKDSAWIERTYVLTVVDSTTTKFGGKADFLTIKDPSTGEWSIKTWHDHNLSDDSLSSWGQLKLRYR